MFLCIARQLNEIYLTTHTKFRVDTSRTSELCPGTENADRQTDIWMDNMASSPSREHYITSVN